MPGNEIDEVMRRCSEDPTLLSPKGIDDIIDYQRKARANFDAGIKPKRSASGKVDLDASLTLSSIGLKTEKPAIKRI